MTRVCGQCRVAGRETILGEKCPKCGAEATQFYAPSGLKLTAMQNATATSGDGEVWFECFSRECPGRGAGKINFIFPRGEGGITTGLCEPCLAEAHKEIPAPARSAAVQEPK